MIVRSLVIGQPADLMSLRLGHQEAAFHFEFGVKYSYAVITELFPKLPMRPTDIWSPSNIVPNPILRLERDFGRLPLADRANQLAVWYFYTKRDMESFIEVAGVKTH